jgi:FAD-dependent halogenase
MAMAVEDFDVVVVGGGPGGSTAATLIARDGHRVLLCEKEKFPRYQIGESLLPATVHGVGELLGVRHELAAAGFQVKRGGTFRWGANPEPWTFTFALSRKLAGATATAYQVDRESFDSILLANAARHGVDVREQTEVLAVEASGERATGVRFRDRSGREHRASARYVVVAAGNASSLYKCVGRREYSDFFRNIAVFGYFEHGKRLPAPNSGNILSAAFGEGWIWYIPLSDTLTSVGAVVAREHAGLIQQNREAALAGFIGSCPLIADYLSAARRVDHGTYGTVRVRKDYSYRTTKFCRSGVLLVGDAACFVDPVFSSGVHLATYSGVLAARSVNTCLAGELSEQACFREFEARYRREFGIFHEFLQAMYDINRDESSYFWAARKVLGRDQPDAEAFIDLVSGVSAPRESLFSLAAPEPSARQFGQALEQATDPGALDDGDAVLAGSGTRLLGSVLREATELQVRAAMKGGPPLPAKPLFGGGLVPSPDGRRWREP